MSEAAMGTTARKEAMKKLRQSRKHTIKTVSARVKAHNKAVQAIEEQLRDHPRTVPEIAEATGIAPSEVLWFLATMKKYGQIVEGDKDGSYFRYRLTGGAREGRQSCIKSAG